jgi:protein TonB
MGTLTSPEYETLDIATLPRETQLGGIKHNRENGQVITSMETDRQPFVRQTKLPEATIPVATMPNDLLIQPDTEAHDADNAGGAELDLSFGLPVQQKALWADLLDSLRDLFFPPKLPPLELTSTPIPVPDRMAVKRNPWAVGISTTINAAVVALMLLLGVKTYIDTTTKPKLLATPLDVPDYKPKVAIASGGGGGSPDKTEASLGRVPPKVQTPAEAPKLESPVPSVDVQPDLTIPDNPLLPNIGFSHSPNVKLGSLGNGKGTGIGSGNGSGYGTGSDHGFGGGVFRIGNGISPPVPLNTVEAEFSDEARRAKYQGEVTVSFIVDVQGNPQNPFVARPLGMGLDEKAVEAVMKYKFRPCMKDRKTPVPCYANLLINFRLY